MLSYGIICEFNPFHNGHEYLIRQTRKITGADTIICAMSGSMVQRGDIAIFDKWNRARWAVQNGADLVVEIPCEYVLQSADKYAYAGVTLLNALGVSGIAFGSECGNKDILLDAYKAKCKNISGYNQRLKSSLNSGNGYPKACEDAMRSVFPDCPETLFLPNATLGMCYIDAALQINPELDFCVVQRNSSHNDTDIDCEFPSSTAIRKSILNGDPDNIKKYGNLPIRDIHSITSYIIGFLRTSRPENLQNITLNENGLAQRIIKCAKSASTLDELTQMCSTKRYTRHRIRRFILCAILGIEILHPINYIRVLAMNKNGIRALKSGRINDKFVTITKTADFDYSQNDAFAKDILATDISSLCVGKPSGADFVTSPIIL